MPLNRRLRTLCTLRSSFATTCGTSAPQGRERGGKAPHLGAQSSGAARKACALLFHVDLRHLSRAGRATGSGAESWRPIVAYAPCVRCAPLSRQPAAPQPRRGANGGTTLRRSIVGRRTLGVVPSSVKPLYGISAMRVRGRHGDFNYGFLWEAVSFCSTGMKRLAFIK